MGILNTVNVPPFCCNGQKFIELGMPKRQAAACIVITVALIQKEEDNYKIERCFLAVLVVFMIYAFYTLPSCCTVL